MGASLLGGHFYLLGNYKVKLLAWFGLHDICFERVLWKAQWKQNKDAKVVSKKKQNIVYSEVKAISHIGKKKYGTDDFETDIRGRQFKKVCSWPTFLPAPRLVNMCWWSREGRGAYLLFENLRSCEASLKPLGLKFSKKIWKMIFQKIWKFKTTWKKLKRFQ